MFFIFKENRGGRKVLKLKNEEFDVQSTEIELKQRMYQEESVVSVQISTTFYPKMANGKIVNGNIVITTDIPSLKSLSELEGKTFEGDSCKARFSISTDGIWDSSTFYDCKVVFGIKEKNKIPCICSCAKGDCELDVVGTLISLYTMSTKEDILKTVFDMNDFYEKPIIKEINQKQILKFIVKNG